MNEVTLGDTLLYRLYGDKVIKSCQGEVEWTPSLVSIHFPLGRAFHTRLAKSIPMTPITIIEIGQATQLLATVAGPTS